MARLKVNIANTPSTLTQGLMYVKDLPADEGMLFQFPTELEACFWGKNTYIPLDVAFVDRDNQITGVKRISPLSMKTVHSDGLCVMAIEANAGFFEKHGIKIGHKIRFRDDKNAAQKEITFITDA